MMNFAAHTPESLLPRSDSKHPATTCKGITLSGRPCRRSLTPSSNLSRGLSSPKGQGVLAILCKDEDHGSSAAAFYCWQHRDQMPVAAKTERTHTEIFPLRERTSIDTLVDRIGVINLEEGDALPGNKHREQTKKRGTRLSTREGIPHDWKHMGGPLMSVPPDLVTSTGRQSLQQSPRPPKSKLRLSLFSCMQDANDDEHPPARIRRQVSSYPVPSTPSRMDRNTFVRPEQSFKTPSAASSPGYRKPSTSTPSRPSPLSLNGRPLTTPTRPSLSTTPKSSTSQTQGLLSFIPSHVSPQSTSILLQELSKPISSSDAAGYIYMFWLTPESDPSKPDDDAASSLLQTPHRSQAHGQRSSDLLQRFASQRRGPTKAKTVLLKIGRAENVHRRLSQWAKQCSHNITLVRYYPYTSARASMQPSILADSESKNDLTLPRKVPHLHRVERLIHVELAEKRVTEQGPCENCGREHREWFEMEATRDGLRAVDEVIRRWVAWAQQQH